MIFKTKLAFELNVSQWKQLSKQKHWGCIKIEAPEGSGGFRIFKRTYWPASFWPCGKEVFIHLSKMQKTWPGAKKGNTWNEMNFLRSFPHYRVLECGYSVSWLGWWCTYCGLSFFSSTSWFSYVFIGDMIWQLLSRELIEKDHRVLHQTMLTVAIAEV